MRALVLAIVVACAASAQAKTGLAPVVVDADLGKGVAQLVQRAALEAIARNGVNPPRTTAVGARLGLARATDPPTTAQCVAAGNALGLDVVLVLRVRERQGRTLLQTELRVVDVAAGEERRYERVTPTPQPGRGARRLAVADARAVLAELFAEPGPWDRGLVDVERALGRDCDAEHAGYLSSGEAAGRSFADHMLIAAEKRKRGGAVVTAVVPALIAGLTTAALLVIVKPWESNDHEKDDNDADVCLGCGFGEMFRSFGIAVLALVGYGATIGALIGGIRVYAKGRDDSDRLRPLVSTRLEPRRSAPELALAPYAGPGGGGLALRLRF
jgi:hypothetical protein